MRCCVDRAACVLGADMMCVRYVNDRIPPIRQFQISHEYLVIIGKLAPAVGIEPTTN